MDPSQVELEIAPSRPSKVSKLRRLKRTSRRQIEGNVGVLLVGPASPHSIREILTLPRGVSGETTFAHVGNEPPVAGELHDSFSLLGQLRPSRRFLRILLDALDHVTLVRERDHAKALISSSSHSVHSVVYLDLQKAIHQGLPPNIDHNVAKSHSWRFG